MPLYEYCCAVCHASEERLCSFEAPTECDCPACGAPNGMRRQISVPAITFAGGGWYAEGYSNSPPAKDKGKAGKTDKADKPACESSPQSAPSGACCDNCPAKK